MSLYFILLPHYSPYIGCLWPPYLRCSSTMHILHFSTKYHHSRVIQDIVSCYLNIPYKALPKNLYDLPLLMWLYRNITIIIISPPTDFPHHSSISSQSSYPLPPPLPSMIKSTKKYYAHFKDNETHQEWCSMEWIPSLPNQTTFTNHYSFTLIAHNYFATAAIINDQMTPYPCRGVGYCVDYMTDGMMYGGQSDTFVGYLKRYFSNKWWHPLLCEHMQV